MNERERIGLFLKKIEILFPLIIILFSCSGEVPELLETWSQVNLIDDPARSETAQTLSFFLHAEDEDGEEDLDQIYLINDDLQLLWSIPREKWSFFTDQGVQWVGFNGLLGPGDSLFPEGNYRVLLVDQAGERAENSFYIRNDIPEKEELQLPEIKFDTDQITVISEYSLFQLWFYDEDGQIIEKSKDLLMGKFLWNDIARNISRRAFSYQVYMEPETGSWGLISGPYFFNGS